MPGLTPSRHKPWAVRGTGTLALPHFSVQTPFLLIFGSADRASQAAHPQSSSQGFTRGQLWCQLCPWASRPSPGVEPLHQQLLPGSSSSPPTLADNQTKTNPVLHAPGVIIHIVYLELHGKACNQDSLRQLPLKASRGFCSQQNSLSKPVFCYFNFFSPYLGRKTQLCSPQNYPAATRLAANLSRTGLPPRAISVTPSGEWM